MKKPISQCQNKKELIESLLHTIGTDGPIIHDVQGAMDRMEEILKEQLSQADPAWKGDL